MAQEETTVTSASPTAVKRKEKAKAKLRHLLPRKKPTVEKGKKPLVPTEPHFDFERRPSNLVTTHKTQRNKEAQSERKNTLIPKKAQNVRTKPTTRAIKLFTRKKQSQA